MIFEHGDRIVFAGDSVTDMGSACPVGDQGGENLGRSYVRIIDNMLAAWYPERIIAILNAGISGNTSRDLHARWDRDILGCSPMWVSICIGINDVWRQFDSPMRPDWAVFPKEYEKNLNVIADKTTVPMLWITPFFIEPNRQDLMRKRVDEYRGIFKSVAKDRGYNVVDVQEIFDEYLQKRYSAYLSWDRVHPGRIGGYLIAKAVVKALIGRSL